MALRQSANTIRCSNQRKYPALSCRNLCASVTIRQPGSKRIAGRLLCFCRHKADATVNGKEREIQQAQNIKKILDKRSQTRKNCNSHLWICRHLIETEVKKNGKEAMAGRRRKNSRGIDPFYHRPWWNLQKDEQQFTL